jgi:predicted RNA binding protein YcfA (HicA-like mRNA interferase family)
MKNNAIPFAALQRVLKELGFVETRVPGSHVVFEHPATATVLLFRTYRPRDQVSAADLVSARKLLDERGVVDGAALDELLHQPSP